MLLQVLREAPQRQCRMDADYVLMLQSFHHGAGDPGAGEQLPQQPQVQPQSTGGPGGSSCDSGLLRSGLVQTRAVGGASAAILAMVPFRSVASEVVVRQRLPLHLIQLQYLQQV